jgi:hypothetical protein
VVRRLQQRVTYANVTATIALFIAVGGTSYAAVQLPRNSVGSAQLRDGSVASPEVRNRSLQATDLSLAARRFLRSQRGAIGPQGPAGPQGPPGTAGAGGTTTAGASTALAVTYPTAAGTVAAGEVTSATASCGAGQRVTGGGVRIESASDSAVRETYPTINNTAWTARVGNDDVSGGPFSYTVFAVCVAS